MSDEPADCGIEAFDPPTSCDGQYTEYKGHKFIVLDTSTDATFAEEHKHDNDFTNSNTLNIKKLQDALKKKEVNPEVIKLFNGIGEKDGYITVLHHEMIHWIDDLHTHLLMRKDDYEDFYEHPSSWMEYDSEVQFYKILWEVYFYNKEETLAFRANIIKRMIIRLKNPKTLKQLMDGGKIFSDKFMDDNFQGTLLLKYYRQYKLLKKCEKMPLEFYSELANRFKCAKSKVYLLFYPLITQVKGYRKIQQAHLPHYENEEKFAENFERNFAVPIFWSIHDSIEKLLISVAKNVYTYYTEHKEQFDDILKKSVTDGSNAVNEINESRINKKIQKIINDFFRKSI